MWPGHLRQSSKSGDIYNILYYDYFYILRTETITFSGFLTNVSSFSSFHVALVPTTFFYATASVHPEQPSSPGPRAFIFTKYATRFAVQPTPVDVWSFDDTDIAWFIQALLHGRSPSCCFEFNILVDQIVG